MSRSAPQSHRRHSRRRGMSLVEVMVVIAIIATIMAVIGFGVLRSWRNAQEQTAELALQRVAEQVEIYALRKRRMPTTADGLATVFFPDPVPEDPWGRPLQLLVPGPDGARFALVSYGADGEAGSSDDIVWPRASEDR